VPDFQIIEQLDRKRLCRLWREGGEVKDDGNVLAALRNGRRL
jgi:hypothetical protein